MQRGTFREKIHDHVQISSKSQGSMKKEAGAAIYFENPVLQGKEICPALIPAVKDFRKACAAGSEHPEDTVPGRFSVPCAKEKVFPLF